MANSTYVFSGAPRMYGGFVRVEKETPKFEEIRLDAERISAMRKVRNSDIVQAIQEIGGLSIK